MIKNLIVLQNLILNVENNFQMNQSIIDKLETLVNRLEELNHLISLKGLQMILNYLKKTP